MNSSRIRWPRNSCEILLGFLSEFWLSVLVSNNSSGVRWPRNSYEIENGFWSEFSSKNRQPWNSYQILQGFQSEFWWLALVSNNSDDYWILQGLDDHGFLVKFFKDFNQNSLQELDDHGILMKIFKDFNQLRTYCPNKYIYTLQPAGIPKNRYSAKFGKKMMFWWVW